MPHFTSLQVDLELYEWEAQFIKVLRNDSGRPKGLDVFFQSQRRYGNVKKGNIYALLSSFLLQTVTVV